MGLGLAAYLIFYVGAASVLSAIAAVGWGGFAVLCACGLVLFALLGTAWFAIIPAQAKPKLATFIWGRTVRDCAGEILPFSLVGGMVIGARAVMLRHVSAPLAFASTIVDVTVEVIAQIAFVLAGLAILIARVPRTHTSGVLVESVAAGLFVVAVGVAIFLLLQRRSFGALERWAARLLPATAAQAGAVHRNLARIHSAPLRLGVSFGFHLASWVATAVWAWIAIRLIGSHLSFPSVLAMEAILYAIRSAALVVPAAIGVQEGAYAVLGPLFGLAAPAAIALSLLKRARDVTLGVPVLVVWQAHEGGHALKANRDAARLLGDK
jgi:putative membrane protein